MADATIQTSFAGGELSPSLYARVDLAKFEVGAALLQNFFVDYRGGAINRPGTEFLYDVTEYAGADDTTPRLLPFIVSTEASYVLVMADETALAFTGGIFVTSIPVPYALEDVARLKYTQSADVMTLVQSAYPPANLNRLSDTTFSYELIELGPTVQPPVITEMRTPHSGAYNYSYLVTSVDLDGKEESLPSNIAAKHCEGQDELNNRVLGFEWTAPDTPVLRYNVFKWGPIDAVTMVPATAWGFIGTAQTVTFTDNNIAPDYAKQPPQWGDPFAGGQIQSIVVTDGGSGYDGVTGDWPAIPFVPLDITGDGTDAAGWAVIDHANGVIVGAFLTNAGKNYTTVTITADGEGGTGAEFAVTLSDPAPLYPACVSYVQQRRVYGALGESKLSTLAFSQPGLYDNFCTTPVSLATDAIAATIASLQVNEIKSLVPVSYGLLAFTSGGCYLVGSSDGPQGTISPANISITQQSSIGANDLIPQLINYDILFGSAKGSRIMRAGFAWEKQSYTTSDITQLAPHLFDTYSIVDWCYADAPFKLLWVVRSDGALLTCTYVPEQDVYAWTRHSTQGIVTSICTVPEGDEDAVYVIVRRHLPDAEGGCWKWYLERFASRLGCCIYDAWHLDSAIRLHQCQGDFPIYLSGVTGEVTVYSYDPCITPSGTFVSECLGGTPEVEWVGNPINYVQPEAAAVPVGTVHSLFVDVNLSQYTASQGTDAYACTDVNELTLWTLEAADIEQLFLDAGADDDSPSAWANLNVWLSDAGDKLIFTGVGVFGSDFYLYVGIADVNGVGVVAPPVLTNYLRMVTSGVALFEAMGTWEMRDSDGERTSLLIMSQDYTTSKVQWFICPSIVDIEEGTYKGQHPGCNGTLEPDQGPTFYIRWTNSTALFVALPDFHAGNVDQNRIGFLVSTPGSRKFYFVCPRGWMDNPNNGFAVNYGATYPLGAAFEIDLTGYGEYASHTWAATEVVDNIALASDPTDVTSSLLLTSEGEPALPWTDEYTRILDEGANDGWIATYGGRPVVDYSNGQPIILFNIIDGNPTYEDSIGLGERVWYARVRGYQWNGGAFVEIPPAEGIVFRQGDLGFSGYNFNDPDSQNISLYAGGIYFQIGQWIGMGGAAGSRSILTQFGTLTSTLGPGMVFGVEGIKANCGLITITEVVSERELVGTVTGDLSGFLVPDDPDGTVRPIEEWTVTVPAQVISGLSHLEGKTVTALADGVVIPDLTVSGGSVDLGAAASSVVVGLPYTSRIKTLYLTDEGIQRGTEQSKRKLLQGANLRVDCTRGLTVGVDFEHLDAVPDLATAVLYTGDAYSPVNPDWNTRGEVCIEQSEPLPAAVLGVIIGVVPGDTGR